MELREICLATVAVTAIVSIAQAQTTTIITHGFGTTSGIPAWEEGMGMALARSVPDASVHRYTPASGDWVQLYATGDSRRNIVLLLDWTDEDDAINPGSSNWGFSQAAAAAHYAAIREPQGSLRFDDVLTGRSVHLIGHSRGTSVNSDISLRMLLGGSPFIDQVTMLDAHPVNGHFDEPFLGSPRDWGDPQPRVWHGISWADYYWRANGIFPPLDLDFDGLDASFFPQAWTRDFGSLFLLDGYSHDHSDVHLWYHGTIECCASGWDGELTITESMRQTWWTLRGFGEGFAYSTIGGHTRPNLGGPSSGRVPIEGRPILPNGGFDHDSIAGWFYHGGGGTAQPSGERLRLRRTEADWRRSNRFWLPLSATELRFDLTTGAASDGDALSVKLITFDGSSPEQFVPLVPAGSRSVAIPIPCEWRGRTVQIEFRLLTGGGSDHYIDNVRIDEAPGRWTRIAAAADPGIRSNGGACWDLARNTMIVFGGHRGTATYGDTWEWNQQGWTRRSPGGPNDPPASYAISMTFDEARGVAVMFHQSETWEWNGGAGIWSRRATSGPPTRDFAAMAYDADRRKVVLFGGGASLSDTWEWDGVAGNWMNRNAQGPPGRTFSAMAYDRARKKIVLFGGQHYSSSSAFNDTWEWDGTAGTWSQVSTQGPAGRSFHSMVYDPYRGRVVMFGGAVYPTNNAFRDTWEWDGISWHQVLSTSPFSARSGAQAAYDILGHRLVVYGGYVAGASPPAPVGDMWAFDSHHNPADFNNDNTVDFFDYLDFVDAFSAGSTSADFNSDNVVDFFDYLDFVDAFSTGC